MNRKSRQAHTRHTLENRPLRHHSPVILDHWHMPGLPHDLLALFIFPYTLTRSVSRICGTPALDPGAVGVSDVLVAEIGFVAFVADVAD